MGRGGLLLLLPLVAVAFLLRTAAVFVLRERWPAAAAAVERWWLWLPLGVVLVVVTVATPVVGLVATAVTVVALTRSSSVGSPFRPR